MYLFFLICLSLLSPLYSQCNLLDIYVETGFHQEAFSSELDGKRHALRESLSSVKWQTNAPELRIGAFYRPLQCISIMANGGVLLTNPSSNQFHATYREEYGCRPFKSRSHSKNRISGNDLSIGIGYVESLTPSLTLTTTLGYAELKRKFKTNSQNFLTRVDPVADPQKVHISDLRYTSHWLGPWLGLQLNYLPCSNLYMAIDAQYHYILPQALQGSWNSFETLSDRFTFENQSSIDHRGKASGIKINAYLTQDFDPQWKISLHAYYERLFIKHTQDSTKIHQRVLNPQNEVFSQGTFKTHPNYQIRWYSWAILGGVDYVF